MKKEILKLDCRYVVQDSETGTHIDGADTIEEAKKILEEYEKTDKKEGNYTEGFYEICEQETGEII